MKIAGSILGVVAGLFSIGLWIVFIFSKDFEIQITVNTFATVVLPACLAIISSLINKKYFMLGAFVWSLPFSLYFMMTPSILAWFIVPCVAYFISFILMFFANYKNRVIFDIKR